MTDTVHLAIIYIKYGIIIHKISSGTRKSQIYSCIHIASRIANYLRMY